MAKRAVAFVSDLLFASNIEATLGRAGFEVRVVEDAPGFEREVDAGDISVVILDLHAGIDAIDIVPRAKGTPVLAFGRHTEPALLRAAREAGCVEVVPRSTFVSEMLDLVLRVSTDAHNAQSDRQNSQ